MSDRPILFSAPMVRAILDGKKTQTRRVVKPTTRDGRQAMLGGEWRFVSSRDTVTGAYHYERGEWCWQHTEDTRRLLKERCPHGQPGDRLWVREEHYCFGHWEQVDGDRKRTRTGRQRWRFVPDSTEVLFEAPASFRRGRHKEDPSTPAWHKRLARFMPRWASRITLEVTSVRVERLQDISEEDAKAEGVTPETSLIPEQVLPKFLGGEDAVLRDCLYRFPYSVLWDSIHGPGAWDANPWVWVVEFKRVGVP